jgi:hypothetical protein
MTIPLARDSPLFVCPATLLTAETQQVAGEIVSVDFPHFPFGASSCKTKGKHTNRTFACTT